ncbi:MAG: HD domain-containing protein [Candidatus Kapaibacteriota bacterium]
MFPSNEPAYNQTHLRPDELEARLSQRGNVLDLPHVMNAYEMAQSVHEAQVRNDGTPYFYHCTRTVKILIDELQVVDTDIIIAALLHDVLEDSTTITRGVLEYNFGSYVAYMVETLTKDLPAARLDPDGVDRTYVTQLSQSSDDCVLIKLAARLDNIRCLQFNLKRNPLVYLHATLDRYVPLAERSALPSLRYVASQIRQESNKYLG